MKEKFLFVIHTPPVSGIFGQETLDAILTMAAFDRKVALLFLDDGVFQLKKGQRPECIDLKDTAPIFQALALYGVEEILVEEESLQERGLRADDLFLPAKPLPRLRVGELLQRQDLIFSG